MCARSVHMQTEDVSMCMHFAPADRGSVCVHAVWLLAYIIIFCSCSNMYNNVNSLQIMFERILYSSVTVLLCTVAC